MITSPLAAHVAIARDSIWPARPRAAVLQEIRRGAGDGSTHVPPLTALAEDERIFRDSVREFAEARVRPLVREMDEQAQMSARARRRSSSSSASWASRSPSATAAPAAASSTRSWRSKSSRASTRRSACWSTSRTRWSSTRCCAGAATTSSSATCRGWPPDTVGAYALSEAGSGSDAFALTTRAREDGDGFVLDGRKLWITNANEADLFIVFATVDPGGRLPRHHRVPRRARLRRASPSARRKTSSASAPAARASCSSTTAACRAANVLGETGKGYKVAIETLNEGRIGIGAQMIGLARGALDARHRATPRSGNSSARRSPNSRPSSTSSPAPRSTSRRRG